MFYKKDNGNWLVANEIHFPNGAKLNSENKESIDGWFWSDEEPQEYIEWKNKQYENEGSI